MVIRNLIGAAAFSVLAGMSSAQTFDCRLDPNSQASLMPPQVIIQMTGSGRAAVAHGWQDGPLTHDVSVRSNGNRSEFGFVARVRVSGRNAPITFNGTLFRGRGELVLSWQSGSGFVGRSSGSFRCTTS